MRKTYKIINNENNSSMLFSLDNFELGMIRLFATFMEDNISIEEYLEYSIE